MYDIVNEETLKDLVFKTNEYLKAKWKPIGGPFKTAKGWGQAVYKDV